MRGNPFLPQHHLRFVGGPRPNPALQAPTGATGTSPGVDPVPPMRWEERDWIVDGQHPYLNCLTRLGIQFGDTIKTKAFVWQDIDVLDTAGNRIATISSPFLAYFLGTIDSKDILLRISEFWTRGYCPFIRPPTMVALVIDDRDVGLDRKHETLLGGCPSYDHTYYECVEIENHEIDARRKFCLIDAASFSVSSSVFRHCT